MAFSVDSFIEKAFSSDDETLYRDRIVDGLLDEKHAKTVKVKADCAKDINGTIMEMNADGNADPEMIKLLRELARELLTSRKR